MDIRNPIGKTGATRKTSETSCEDNAWSGYTYKNLRQEIGTMLSRYATIWDVQLGNIRTIKSSIDLEPSEASPVLSAPYRAGTAAQQL